MRIIGITGGIGAGKTEVLSFLREKTNCDIIVADQVAHAVKEPGQPCYNQLVELLGSDILEKNGKIDNAKMAEQIFKDNVILREVNQIIHPMVKEYILKQIQQEKRKNQLDFLFIEAALLIEENYMPYLDELWYIYTREDIRRNRLYESREYSEEKTEQIISKQLSEEQFRKYSDFTIDNSNSLEDTYKQINKKLGEYL